MLTDGRRSTVSKEDCQVTIHKEEKRILRAIAVNEDTEIVKSKLSALTEAWGHLEDKQDLYLIICPMKKWLRIKHG